MEGMDQYALLVMLMVAFTGALQEALKKLGLNVKYVPLINLVIGVVGGILFGILTKQMQEILKILISTISGAMGAGGTYDLLNKLRKKEEKTDGK